MSSPAASPPAACSAPVIELYRSLLLAPSSAASTIALQACLPMRLTPVEDSFRPFFAVRNLLFFAHPSPAATATAAAVGANSTAATAATDKDVHEPAFMNTRRMEASLRRLLRSYPLLSARIELRTQDGGDPATSSPAAAAASSPVVTSLSGGVSWVCSSCPSLRLSDLSLGREEFPGPSILPSQGLIEPLVWEAPLSAPLVALTHTRFGCGGVCLGFHMQHYLADGEGYFRVLHDLAELYRSQPLRRGSAAAGEEEWTDAELDALPTLKVQPCFDRSWLQPSPAQLAESRAAHESSVGGFHVVPASPPSTDESSSSVVPPQPPASSVRVFRFEASEIAAMKREACATSGQPWLSSFEALAAHVSRCIYAARTSGLDESTVAAEWPSMRVDIASNLRGRLSPRSDSEATLVRSHEILWGNAVLPAIVELPRSALDPLASLSVSADSIHASLSSLSSAELWRTLSWLAWQAPKAGIWQSLRMERGLILSAWSKFRAHDVFFEMSDVEEAGAAEPVRPLRICPASRPAGEDGWAALLDTPARDGSIDLCVSMRIEHGDAMMRSKELHRFRTVVATLGEKPAGLPQ